MLFKHINLIFFKSIVVILLTTMLFSCSKKIDEVKRFYQDNESIPISETKDFKLTYTLLGQRVLVLSAPLMIDYSNQKNFAYQYFPNKIKIEVINNKTGEKTIIKADKAYIYKNPNLAELIGNVQIIGQDGSSLLTTHLYWDGENQHVFGEDKTILKQNDEQIIGYGFDSSLDFKNVRLNKIAGVLRLQDQISQ